MPRLERLASKCCALRTVGEIVVSGARLEHACPDSPVRQGLVDGDQPGFPPLVVRSASQTARSHHRPVPARDFVTFTHQLIEVAGALTGGCGEAVLVK